ncbi:Fic family protein [Pseudomonas sp. Choline-3u-10]|jgi:Fic family protein|uniref:Fic family protein n=1 Tax=Pseudomonadaceae TaxID=135621 RepID=UPI000617DA68|nr:MULTISPECIES: Fic family protein [Pseudomonadaceae]MBU0948044.1 Fic family protein [Gammaproteobacteria bacterium]HBM10336.1 Fic family protein [Pseudomonas sp.]KJJ61511.1 Fic family protein [Pseudomonas sp. 10B238]MBK3796221.1 Fic family protein [Stutzerimonas stutzeri]MBK3876724.1 Fic family protein [Stutzerimonas stutzeri]|tara:strand:- start:1219 stop:2373 length:1155 start_codon:yes stop_codon:yes gene_type:complete
MPTFTHHDLELLNPSFDSGLVDVLSELEHLRRLRLEGDTPPQVFYQLKSLFHALESLGSARIEGNHTTLADYIDSKVEGKAQDTDQLREVGNIEKAMDYIEQIMTPGALLTEQTIRELHAMTVDDLVREGDKTPGAYRSGGVRISQSDHLPPDFIQVQAYMQELVDFVNREDSPKYDLMKVALAHHRFGWIHPFGNGNGRVVRLLTYALLMKYGFNVSTGGRVLNPTAVFCNDRERYYAMLATADKGTKEGLEEWCTYVLEGIRDELEKVDRLTNYAYLTKCILAPAVAFAREREWITETEETVLSAAIKLKVVKSADVAAALPQQSSNQRTYLIKKLVDQGMLLPLNPGARQYTIGFSNNYLIRGVIKSLRDQGFIPEPLEKP